MTIESTNVQLPLQPPLLIASVSGCTSWDEWMTLRVILQIVPFGDESQIREIGRLNISNEIGRAHV